MSSIPVWIQVLQALLTPAIAIAVGVVAFLQWRTAHQKVVLDLFERRLKIYDAVSDVVLQYVNHQDKMPSSEALSRLRGAEIAARFLFGEEVHKHIDALAAQIDQHRRLERRIASDKFLDDEREKMIDASSDIEDHLGDMLRPWTTLLLPYLKMDQKRVLSPAEWLSMRNRIRLSHADEKQK
ncbi:hypothetical protein [Neorhizobium tomejilense]|uniref:hypothetical protein n=1 Tax=Neorhizobium tomejilense TaxID=2093828 RepID=UPI000CF88E60|nr:hypothetical protein [Neorhizobium tomejilense]